MLITKQFILINIPKTGSTFVRESVKQLHGARRIRASVWNRLAAFLGLINEVSCKELYMPKTEYPAAGKPLRDQHGRYEQVPSRYGQKPVVSVVRDPVIRNISFYEYGWWKKYYEAPREEVERHFPKFPNLDFREYLNFQKFNSHYRDTGSIVPEDVGEQTVTFFQYFFRDPKNAFKKLDEDYIYAGEYRHDLPELYLLRTESLNDDLREFLSNLGYPDEELSFIIEKQPVRPEATKRKSAEERYDYLTDDIIDSIKHAERYLYRIYADFGICY